MTENMMWGAEVWHAGRLLNQAPSSSVRRRSFFLQFGLILKLVNGRIENRKNYFIASNSHKRT